MELIASGALALAWWILMFAAAGTIRWPAGWIYLAVLVVGLVSHRAFVGARNPEILVQRARIGAGTKRWDVAWLTIFWPLMVAVPVVAGIDTVRLGHRQLAAWHVAVGSILFGAGMAASSLAMAANPFFEGTARIQPGQGVIDTGPYRRVRHPGYAGLVLWSLSSPFLLRSAMAFVPALLAAGWIVVRTVLEDRMLRRELPGYERYARRVPWRLVPGVW
jgi:protein-S-isoprenylcysteine O-methyltransferase Ste14